MLNEVIAFSYENIGYDNDVDGLVDEDTWGGLQRRRPLDDDGDCLAMAANPGFQRRRHGVRTRRPRRGRGLLGTVHHRPRNSREIYLIPMLNVDGNIYDREVFCPAPPGNHAPVVDGARTYGTTPSRASHPSRSNEEVTRTATVWTSTATISSNGERRWVRPGR